jgi:hypothetical protein
MELCCHDDCLCKVVEGTRICEAGHDQGNTEPCQICGRDVPVHSGWSVGQPVWCLECYNLALQ